MLVATVRRSARTVQAAKLGCHLSSLRQQQDRRLNLLISIRPCDASSGSQRYLT